MMGVLLLAVRRVLSLNGLTKSYSKPQQLRYIFTTNSSSSSSNNNNSNPLLLKLLKLPPSKIKSTLDDDDSDHLLHQSDFSALITSLTSSSPDKARLVLEWRLDWMLNNNERDHIHYSNLISLCAKIPSFSLAVHIFSLMEAKGIHPTTALFNSLIHVCFSSTSHVLTALSLFEIMQSSHLYTPNSKTYDAFILGFSDLRDVDKMLAWFSAKRASGFSPNLHNYECIIGTCVRGRDFDKVDRYYDEMMSMGVMPSVAVLELILEGLCKRRNCDKVCEFLNFLMECRFGFTGSMVDKVVELYSELGKINQMEKLLEIFTEFNEAGEAFSRLHCGIIRFYAKVDRLDDVEYSVGRMMSRGMIFRSSDDVEKVISSYFRNEAYDRLDLFLEHVKGYQKLTRSTYDLLVAGYRRAGLAEKLELVIHDMKLSGLL